MQRISAKKISFALAAVASVFFVWTAYSRHDQAPQQLLAFRGSIRDAALSADGSLIACGEYSTDTRSKDQVAVVTPAGEVQLIAPKGWNANIERVSFSADGRYAFGSSQWGIWIGEVRNGRIERHITTPAQTSGESTFWKLRTPGRLFSKNDGTIACISSGVFGRGPLQLERWRASDAKFLDSKVIVPTMRDNSMFSGATLSNDGVLAIVMWNHVETTGNSTEFLGGGELELWDVNAAKPLRRLTISKPRGLGKMVFSPDSKYIAAADSAGNGFIWETRSGELIQKLSGLRHRTKHSNGISMGFSSSFFSDAASLAFSPDNRTLFAALNDGAILAYDVRSGLAHEVIARLDTPKYSGKGAQLIGCSPDGKRLYALKQNGASGTLLALKTPRHSASAP